MDEQFLKDFYQHFGYWNQSVENMNDRDEIDQDIKLLEALDHQFTTWQDDMTMKILSNNDLSDEERAENYKKLINSERYKKLSRMSKTAKHIAYRYWRLNELKNRRTSENLKLRANQNFTEKVK